MRFLLLLAFTCQLAFGSYIFSSGGGGSFATITGDPSDNAALTTALDAKAPKANPVFTGVGTFPDGTAAAPTIMNAGDTDTGIYWPSGDGDTMGIATAGTGNILFGANGLATLLKNGPSTYTYQLNYGAGGSGVQGLRINANGAGLSAYFEHAANNKGYAIFTLDAAGFANKWRYARIDGNYFSGWFGEHGQVYWGGNQVGQKGGTLTIEGQPDKSNVGGTTTANASTTITGSSTSFLEHFGVGDRVSLSSSAGTYATITAIASNTSMTVDTALGDGTSQTLNRKMSVARFDKATGSAVYGLINDAGKWTIGEASTTETHRLNTAVGTLDDDTLTLTNGPDGKAGNPAVYIKLNINGTDRYIPAW